MREYQEELNNGLSCSIDWLSFTITDCRSIGEALGMFGFNFVDFYECERGAMGYTRMLILNGSTLRVLFDGNDNMGVHFDVSGSAVGDLFDYYKRMRSELTPWDTMAVDLDIQIMSDLLSSILKVGHISRLDLAVDNKEQIYYRVSELATILKNGRFISKFRTWRDVIECKTSGETLGHTVYLGSRMSSVMLRVYDKQLEQNSKRRESDEVIEYEWVRWELELKEERAQVAAEMLAQGLSVGEVCVGVLANYLRIINFDDSNKSRCSTDIKWDSFIDGVEKLRLYIPHEEVSIDDKKNWIIRQVAPTLTAVIIANYGDISFLMNYMDLYAGRMKRNLRDLVSQAHPGWENCFEQFAS